MNCPNCNEPNHRSDADFCHNCGARLTPPPPPTLYTVTFNSQGGSSVASQTVVPFKKAIQPSPPTRAKHKFVGWYKEPACVNVWNFATDVVPYYTTLYAKWSKPISIWWELACTITFYVVTLLLIFITIFTGIKEMLHRKEEKVKTETKKPEPSKDNDAIKEKVPAVVKPFETPPSKPESVSLNQPTLSLEMGQSKTLTATVHPANAPQNIEWSSNNVSVATVNNGVVTAVRQGKAVITVRSSENNNVFAICTVTVTEITISYSFGRYEGNTVNGIPGGQGKMTYTCRVQIAKHGRRTVYAESGDTFEGSFYNGDIEDGNLRDRNNNPKATIFAGRRPSPYNLANDRCE